MAIRSHATRAMANLTINSKLRMNSGYEIPVLGFGVYQTPAAECEEVVAHAFKTGYTHVDSAAVYRNEVPTSKAIHTAALPRTSYFFTTKIPPRSLSYKNTVSQIRTSLRITSLSYLDLVLIHAPYGGPTARKDAWRALVEAQEAGLVRSLGVSNYGVHHLDELEGFIKELEAERGGPGKGGRIDVGQWEIHPWLPRTDILEWCRARHVVVEAYSPLVRGTRMGEPVLVGLAEKHGRTPAQVLLRWSLQKGLVPLPKSVTKKRIEENADVFGWELDEGDMKSLETGEYKPCAWDPTVSRLEQ